MDTFRKAEKRKEKERAKLEEDPIDRKKKSKFPKLAKEAAGIQIPVHSNLIELPEEGEALDEVAMIYDILDVEEIDLRKGGFNRLPPRPVTNNSGIVSRGAVIEAVANIVEAEPSAIVEAVSKIESAPVMLDLIKASAIFVPSNVKRKMDAAKK